MNDSWIDSTAEQNSRSETDMHFGQHMARVQKCSLKLPSTECDWWEEKYHKLSYGQET